MIKKFSLDYRYGNEKGKSLAGETNSPTTTNTPPEPSIDDLLTSTSKGRNLSFI